MNYHFNLHRDSVNICKQFKGPFEGHNDTEKLERRVQNLDEDNILFNTIRFCKDYGDFEKNAGTFYFDDYISEQFMVNLKNKLLEVTSDMISDDYIKLNQFFAIETIKELRNNQSFKIYRDVSRLWLSDIGNAKKLFLNHSVFWRILFVKVIKVVLVNYTSSSRNDYIFQNIVDN